MTALKKGMARHLILDHRARTLTNLINHLQGVDLSDLDEYSVEEIMEGFWIAEKVADDDSINFTLEG